MAQKRQQSETGGSATATEEEVSNLFFGLNVSIRYHQKRRSFFELLHRVTIGTAMVTSSAAFAVLFSSPDSLSPVAKWFALSVLILTAFDWIIGYSEKAKLHDQLYRRFTELAAEAVSFVKPTPGQIRRWSKEVLLIESDEPGQLRVLTRVCQNEELQAQGYDLANQKPVEWWQRLVMHFASVGQVRA